jgi:hypothetical protein
MLCRAQTLTGLAAIFLMLLMAKPARADVVSDWAELQYSISQSGNSDGASDGLTHKRFDADRHQAAAKVALAMFEAANATNPTYASYLNLSRSPANASPMAAISTAAHDVLIKLYPGHEQQIEALYTLSMESIATDEASTRGIAVGKAAAIAALAAGGLDPVLPLGRYRPTGLAGKWVPSAVPFPPEWVAVKPWFLRSASEHRGPPPPDLASRQWATAFNEIKRFGAINSKERSPVDTIRAQFWVAYDFYPAVRQIADRPGRTLVRNARLYALLSMVGDDLKIITADGKVAHNFWRPMHAIRSAELDGNEATESDTEWLPLLETPAHPEYPCAHCLFAVARATILDGEGPAPPEGYRFTSLTLPGIMVTVPSMSKFAEQVMVSRIHGGVHFRTTNDASAAIAKQFARAAMADFAPPLPPARP